MANPGVKRQNRFHSAVEAIVKGRQKATLAELIEVIHQVNPTDRLLDDRESAERYRLKSMMQSFLINQHRDLVQVAPMPGQNELFVSLSVVGEPRGACHARLDQLAPEARSWVRLQLDIGDQGQGREPIGTGQKGKRKSKEGSDPGDPLASARLALEEYDFPRARELAELAWSARGDEESGVFLLELLVDHLGLFAEALDFGDRLPAAIRGSSSCRCLLARAATHSEEFARAREFLHKLANPQAVESWLALAHAALAKGDLVTAEEGWRELNRMDDTLSGLADLRSALLAAQTRARRPEIESLLQAWGAGCLGDEEAEAQARQFLDQGLLHPGLTELVKTVAGKKKEAARAAALAQAEKLFARAEYGLAAQSYAAALELGGEAGVEARLAEAKNRAQAQKEEERLAGLIAAMQSDTPQTALAEYLELAPVQRARVKAEAGRPEIERVEELAESARGVSAKEVVAAALALEQAEELLGRGEWLPLLSVLEPHKAALKRCSRAKQLEAAANEGVEAENRVLARERLGQVRAALRRGKAAEAAALLPTIDPAFLSPEEEELRASYQQRSTLQIERARLERELLLHEEKAAWMRVRENLDALREQGRAEELLLSRLRQEIEGRIKRQFRLCSFPLTDSPLPQMDIYLTGDHGQCRSWLSGDGQTLAFPTCRGSWITIRLFDLAAATWGAAIVFRVGEGWELHDFLVAEDGFWLAGGQGEVFVVARDGSHLQAIYPPVQNLGSHLEIESMFLAPPHHLWLKARDHQDQKQKGFVLSLGKRTLREAGEMFMAGRLEGREPLHMWRTPWPGERVAVHSAPGHRLVVDEIEDCPAVSQMVMASQGRGWAVLVSVESGAPGWVPHLVLSWVGEEGGRPRHATAFPEALGRMPFCLATSRQAGCSFLHYRKNDDTHELVALVVTEEGICENWRLSGLDPLCLVTDYRTERVVAIFPDDNNLPRPVELGLQPPAAVPRRKRKLFEYDFGMQVESCWRQPKERQSQALTLQSKLLNQLPLVREAWIARQVEKGQVEKLLTYHHAFKLLNKDNLLCKVEAGLVAIAPDHLEVVILRCHTLIKEHNYGAVRALLEKIDWSADLGGHAEHLHHLLGLTHLAEGDLAEAVRIWKRGLASAGEQEEGCRLRQRIATVEEGWQVMQGASTAEELGDFAWLLQWLPHVDNALAAGREDKAFELLHCGRHWNSLNTHSMARLAQACLLREPRNPAEQLQWYIILCAFVDLWAEKDDLESRRPLPPQYRLAPELLDQLRAEAQAWLAQDTLSGAAGGELPSGCPNFGSASTPCGGRAYDPGMPR